MRRYLIVVVCLAFNYLFFIEYLSPLRRVHIPYDLDSYHYSLADYAFQALKDGRFPEWDWTIYCGQSFVGNTQAALFYPPTWLMFAADFRRPNLSYQTLQIFELAHVSLAFLLCYAWLRGRRLEQLACVLGAGVFAYSGYMLLQLQHMGLIAGYAWFPLGLWGIDQAAESGHSRPLWKLVVASALCFLAGYPPIWFVFAVLMTTYALFKLRWRAALGTIVGLSLSLALAMIQMLPAWEAVSLKSPEVRYGLGIRSAAFFLSYLFPNFFNFGMNVDVHANPGKEYLYLGAPAVFGLLCLARRNFRDVIPFVAVGVVSLIMITNPYGLVWSVIRHSTMLPQICRDWYFLAGLTVAAAPLAAYGLDDFLRRKPRPVPQWFSTLSVVLLCGWCLWELVRWLPGGAGFASGWRSVADPSIMLLVFALGMYAVRAGTGRLRPYLTAALLLAVGVDYKVFGTSKRFNAAAGSGQRYYSASGLPEMDSGVYAQIRSGMDYRILVDLSGPSPLDLRHYDGLRTPQGFDPFFTTQYGAMLEGGARFRNGWEFSIDPDQENLLRLLGVRFFITGEGQPQYASYLASSAFRRIGSQGWYKVFEYQNARPTFGWEPGISGTAERVRFIPEEREFVVHSAAGGRFALHEQLAPSWRAFIDEHSVPLERWRGAFQAVSVPAGEHRVRFEFRSRGLRLGALISATTICALVLGLFLPRIRAGRRRADGRRSGSQVERDR